MKKVFDLTVSAIIIICIAVGFIAIPIGLIWGLWITFIFATHLMWTVVLIGFVGAFFSERLWEPDEEE